MSLPMLDVYVRTESGRHAIGRATTVTVALAVLKEHAVNLLGVPVDPGNDTPAWRECCWRQYLASHGHAAESWRPTRRNTHVGEGAIVFNLTLKP